MRLAFVDLETTGGSPVDDRITEVGIVEVDVDAGGVHAVREWSTLVNPGLPVPGFIEGLTGITNAMVACAPPFDDVAAEVLARLEGRLFVAHNARFDHGFLKNAFRRLGRPFRADVLCTVRLSRRLYPGFARHNLDTLIERHRLVVEARHRALGDAKLLWQLWQRLHVAFPADEVARAVDRVTARPSLPRHLDPDVLERLPKTAGVYLFYGEADDGRAATRPLYVGKAKNLRQRVLAHFSGDHLSTREMEISQQLRRIEWVETGGGTQHDTGALLMEAALVKRLRPAYNRLLRRNEDLCAWRLVEDPRAPAPALGIARPHDLFFAHESTLYGPFVNPRAAKAALRGLADAHGLCAALLKLEKVAPGKPCFSHQVGRCRGTCVGRESFDAHTRRLKDALAPHALAAWPSRHAVVVREGTVVHVVRDWAYLGMADATQPIAPLAARDDAFDADVYAILRARGLVDCGPRRIFGREVAMRMTTVAVEDADADLTPA